MRPPAPRSWRKTASNGMVNAHGMELASLYRCGSRLEHSSKLTLGAALRQSVRLAQTTDVRCACGCVGPGVFVSDAYSIWGVVCASQQ